MARPRKTATERMWQKQKKMAQHLLIISWGGEERRAEQHARKEVKESEPKGWCIISVNITKGGMGIVWKIEQNVFAK